MEIINFFVFFAKIICSENESKNVCSKFNIDVLNFKTYETRHNFVISICSNEFLPLNGDWYVDEIPIYSEQFYAETDKGVFNWLYENIFDKTSASLFINNFGNYIFEHKIRLEKLEGKDSLVFRLNLLKREDLQTILTSCSGILSFLNHQPEDNKGWVFLDMLRTIISCQIIVDIKFVYNQRKKPRFIKNIPVLNTSEKKKKSIFKQKSFKHTVIEVAKHTFVGLAIFGPYGLLLSYLISRYIIKN